MNGDFLLLALCCIGPWSNRVTAESVSRAENIKGVVAYLTSESKGDVSMLMHSLRLLQLNFLERFPYDVIVFHDGLSADDQSEILSAGPKAIRFEEIKLPGLPACLNATHLQEHVDRAAVHRASLVAQRGSGARNKSEIGYRYTNRWVHGLMGYERAFDLYDFAMRLDTDSFLVDAVDVDPFEAMAEGGHAIAIEHNPPQLLFA